jgi:hypothetical protein
MARSRSLATAALTLVAASLLAGCASDGPRARGHRLDLGGPRERDRDIGANPSAVIAAELAFARAAREDGTWTAFREFSTEDALWPAPALTNVRRDLAGQADPAEPIVWAPDAVWVSCDGSFALSTGPATYPGGRRARFATIWQRQRNGEYRWVLDQGFELEPGYAAPEMIGARITECPEGFDHSPRRRPEVRRGEAWGSGRSNDGTLEWSTAIAADCSRTFTVRASQSGTMSEVFRRESPAPAAPQGQPAPSCPA